MKTIFLFVCFLVLKTSFLCAESTPSSLFFTGISIRATSCDRQLKSNRLGFQRAEASAKFNATSAEHTESTRSFAEIGTAIVVLALAGYYLDPDWSRCRQSLCLPRSCWPSGLQNEADSEFTEHSSTQEQTALLKAQQHLTREIEKITQEEAPLLRALDHEKEQLSYLEELRARTLPIMGNTKVELSHLIIIDANDTYQPYHKPAIVPWPEKYFLLARLATTMNEIREVSLTKQGEISDQLDLLQKNRAEKNLTSLLLKTLTIETAIALLEEEQSKLLQAPSADLSKNFYQKHLNDYITDALKYLNQRNADDFNRDRTLEVKVIQQRMHQQLEPLSDNLQHYNAQEHQKIEKANQKAASALETSKAFIQTTITSLQQELQRLALAQKRDPDILDHSIRWVQSWFVTVQTPLPTEEGL